MSRIGNAPVTIPKEVTIVLAHGSAMVKGPKGELTVTIPQAITVSQEGDTLTAARTRNDKKIKSLHGTVIAHIKNAIVGVTAGWTKQLELSGVGYRAALTGTNLTLTVGFSHPVTITPPAGITFAVNEGKVVVSGIDKYLVGQVAASVRAVKPPEPYKGKGIKYVGERIRKKAGKSAKAVGGAGGAK